MKSYYDSHYDPEKAKKIAGCCPGSMLVYRRRDGTFFWFIDYGNHGWRAADVAWPEVRQMVKRHGSWWQRLCFALHIRTAMGAYIALLGSIDPRE